MSTNQDYLPVAETAARAAGKELLERLGTTEIRHKKNRFDLVTEADVAAQETVRGILLDAFPDHGFLGEEGNPSQGRRTESGDLFRWIVDPLDGTTNFVHGMPMFCVSIGLARGEELLCGVIFNPMTNDFFRAVKGHGAYWNDRPIRTSTWPTLGESLVSVSFPTVTTDDSPDLAAFLKSLKVCQAIRRTGSTALNLAYVAAGIFGASWSYQCHPWDIAAGTLLVLEAGGIVVRPDGKPLRLLDDPCPICAVANTSLHEELLVRRNILASE